MRKIVFIALIVAVVAVVGIYTALEFRVSEIVFVTDRTETWAYGQEMAVRRLYNSGVDVDAFFTDINNMLISAEFTEDEIYAAALASGVPEFYPAFYFSIYSPSMGVDEFDFTGRIKQEFAPEQENINFRIADLKLEVMTDGIMVSDLELRAENPAEKIPGTPVMSGDKRQLAIDLTNVSGYSLKLTGTGRVTFQYTYNIVTNNLFTNNALENQLLVVHANIFRGAGGELTVEYMNEPYSNLEDYNY